MLSQSKIDHIIRLLHAARGSSLGLKKKDYRSHCILPVLYGKTISCSQLDTFQGEYSTAAKQQLKH